jgi:ribokinase
VAVRFVAIGDLMLDLTVSGAGHEAAIELCPGGSAVNAAVWAASAGATATVVGTVGDDLAGRALRAFLAEAGIRAALTVDPCLRTGTFALVDGTVRVDRGANAAAVLLPQPPAADVALVSGYLPPEVVETVLRSVDAALIALSAGRLPELPEGAGVVLANATEARALTGENEPARAARLLAGPERIACVTLGADGAVAAGPGGLASARPPKRHPAGARGAGDAFAAAFLVDLAGGASLREALEGGCLAGSSAAA